MNTHINLDIGRATIATATTVNGLLLDTILTRILLVAAMITLIITMPWSTKNGIQKILLPTSISLLPVITTMPVGLYLLFLS